MSRSMSFRNTIPLLLMGAFFTTLHGADVTADLFDAAKKGDAAAIKVLLSKGADVNAKNAYGATALSFAAEKGRLDVVKLLLQHKADVNVKDAFYNLTPLSWALLRGHADVVKALLEAGATGGEEALSFAVAKGQTEIVRVILKSCKLKEEALNRALAATSAKDADIAELLKKAGAKIAPATAPPVDHERVAAFTGAYRGDEGLELTISIVDGKLSAQIAGGLSIKLTAVDQNSFKSDDGLTTIAFQREGGTVNSLNLKYAKLEMTLRRATPPKEPAPGLNTVTDLGGEVKSPLNWPSFRGPNASGVADGQFPPLAWDVGMNRNILWRTPIPGLGHSCPIVWENRIYVTTAVSADGKAELKTGEYGDVDSVKETAEQAWKVFCLDKRDGKVIWERTACKGVPKNKRHTKGSHANPTPATDGGHIVCSFGSEGLYCYDREGKLLWEKSLGVIDSGWFYDADYQWGFGSSPIIWNGLAIAQCDGGKNSFLAAFRVADGKEVWRKSRDEIPSWGTPTIVEGLGRVQLVTNATKYARGYDPATGDERWRLARHAEITIPTPVFGDGLIFVTSGYSPIQPIYAVRTNATGDISLKNGKTSSDAVAWSTEKGGPYMPTPIVYHGHLYICSNAGIVTCYVAKTGKQLYKERLGGPSGFTASPVAADGKIYFTSEESGVRVIRSGPKYELLAVNPLGEPCLATPAISDGAIFIRTQHYLYGIGRKK